MSLVALLAGGGLFVVSTDVSASHSIDFEQRRAEREAEREARRAEKEAEREARRAEREARRAGQNSDNEEPTCSCRSRLKFSDPDLQWRGATLVLVPRVDMDIRTRGDVAEDPAWKAVLKYNGMASYSSDDISAPTNKPVFSGTKEIAAGMCGDNRYSFKGYSLPAVPLTGLTPGLVTNDQELEGTVKMNATLEGCDLEQESRAFDFTLDLSFTDYGKKVAIDRPEQQLTVKPQVFSRFFGEGKMELRAANSGQ